MIRRLMLTLPLLLVALIVSLAGCTTPTMVEVVPGKVVLDGAGATQQLEARVFDQKGQQIREGVDIVWFSTDTKLIKLSTDGEVTGLASGEARVEAEVVGTALKAYVDIRIKIPSSVKVSHERLRLWVGQVKENVWAEVHSEKNAFIEGYLPTWSSEDPEIVKVEPIVDPNRRQSWVRMTGMKSGTTYVTARFQSIAQNIRVAVFAEDEQVLLDGTRVPTDAAEEQSKTDKQ